MPRPEPIYRIHDLNPAYQLRYAWAAWSSRGERLPTTLSADFLKSIDSLWEGDGLGLLESRIAADRLQITFSTQPAVSPVMLAARAKGRLDHALRRSGTPVSFSRKVAVRSIGDTRRDAIEAYIQRQATKEPFVDERFRVKVRGLTVINRDVDLSVPSESRSGRYWYNLHVVLVTRERARLTDIDSLAAIRDTALRIAEKKRYPISRLAVMPDHLHMALRGNIEHSPQDIAPAFLNNLAYAMGQNAIWQSGYYAGTFGEYDMGAVRQSVRESRLEA